MTAIQKLFFISASFLGLSGVTLGAFGAHALKDKLSLALMSAYQTGVAYQFYHCFALFVVSFLLYKAPANKGLMISGCLFLVGVCLFSGSLYSLAFGAPKAFGVITPLGGMLLILAWCSLCISLFKLDIV